MPTVIAFANQKGGVGKTTIATQFAYYLRLQKKKKVLFLDMDAQGSASETLNERNPIAGTTSQALFREELDGINVDKTPRGIDLIGSNQSPEAYDVESLPLAQVLNPKKWLAPILGNYDYVVIDCPPSLGRFAYPGGFRCLPDQTLGVCRIRSQESVFNDCSDPARCQQRTSDFGHCCQ